MVDGNGCDGSGFGFCGAVAGYFFSLPLFRCLVRGIKMSIFCLL